MRPENKDFTMPFDKVAIIGSKATNRLLRQRKSSSNPTMPGFVSEYKPPTLSEWGTAFCLRDEKAIPEYWGIYPVAANVVTFVINKKPAKVAN